MLLVITKIYFILSFFSNNEAVLYEGDSCKIRDWTGVCTNQDQCPQLRQAYIKGLIRNDEIPRCGYTLNKEIICCPTETLSALKWAKVADRVDGSAAIDYCRELQNLPFNEMEFHVVNGLPVRKNEYRFMASIGTKSMSELEDIIQFHCGGTLISDRYILTAAHCVSDSRNKPNIVMLGSLNLNEAFEEILIAVKQTHIHPDFRSSSTYDDIALIELEVPVKFTADVYPLCLHTDTSDPSKEGKVYVAGWGRTENAAQSNRLLKAELSVVPLETCKSEVGRMIPSRRLSNGVQNAQICAKGDEKDACEGDSGGPLIYENAENVVYVGGITVAGFGCMGNMPGIYTRVASYLNFIENIVWPR